MKARKTFPPPWHLLAGRTASRQGQVEHRGRICGSLEPICQERSGRRQDWPRWSTTGTHLHWCNTEAAACRTHPGEEVKAGGVLDNNTIAIIIRAKTVGITNQNYCLCDVFLITQESLRGNVMYLLPGVLSLDLDLPLYPSSAWDPPMYPIPISNRTQANRCSSTHKGTVHTWCF